MGDEVVNMGDVIRMFVYYPVMAAGAGGVLMIIYQILGKFLSGKKINVPAFIISFVLVLIMLFAYLMVNYSSCCAVNIDPSKMQY